MKEQERLTPNGLRALGVIGMFAALDPYAATPASIRAQKNDRAAVGNHGTKQATAKRTKNRVASDSRKRNRGK